MLPDIGMAELLLLAMIALIVVGPKDLPTFVRQVGKVVRKARGMASELHQAFDEMGREAEIEQLRKEVRALKRMEPLEDVKRELNQVDQETRQAVREDAKS